MCVCVQIEGQKAVQVRTQKERAAMSKLDKLKADQTQRAETLAANAMTAEEQVSAPGSMLHWRRPGIAASP